MERNNYKKNEGYFILTVIIFGAVFATLVSALFGFATTQKKFQIAKNNGERAFQIAEAGLDYYKWFLAHYPDDVQDGTGESGPYIHDYKDPEGSIVGEFSLEINANTQCGDAMAVEITSTGRTEEAPEFEKTVYGRYSRPSVAEYSYIINDNVWAGGDREIVGPYHSNGGIRMDGENQSIVTSAVETWVCTGSFGCDTSEEKPGVFGEGENYELWEFPVPQMDFNGIAVDFSGLKDKAQNGGGLYFPSVGGRTSDRKGYHMIFKNDGSFDLYEVEDTDYHWSKHIDDTSDWQRDYYTIDDEDFVGNYPISNECAVVFFEDRLWIEGEVNGKFTIASADIEHGDFDPDVVINNDLTYSSFAEDPGLTVMAENSVLIPLYSPNSMEINGIFVAQKGYFGRNLYPCWYWSYDKRDSLEIVGSIVSSKRVGTKWSYSTWGCWDTWSGYASRENKYDRNLAVWPPPFTPSVSEEYDFVEWREGGKQP